MKAREMADGSLQRVTRQRRVLLEELKHLTSHPTADELYEIVRRRLPKISLGTVYRNLELLSQNGLIQRLQIAGAKARFDGNPSPHDHVRCVRCGRVDDIHGPHAEVATPESERAEGYEILGHRLEFIGTCPECCGKQTPSNEVSLHEN